MSVCTGGRPDDVRADDRTGCCTCGLLWLGVDTLLLGCGCWYVCWAETSVPCRSAKMKSAASIDTEQTSWLLPPNGCMGRKRSCSNATLWRTIQSSCFVSTCHTWQACSNWTNLIHALLDQRTWALSSSNSGQPHSLGLLTKCTTWHLSQWHLGQ